MHPDTPNGLAFDSHPSESFEVQEAWTEPGTRTRGQDLSRLEHALDGRLWALAERVAATWRQRRRERQRQLPTSLFPPLDDPATTVPDLTAGLEWALSEGALLSAEAFTQRLLSELSSPSGSTLPDRALTLVVEALIMSGQRSQAAELSSRYRARLEASSGGVSCLELLGYDDLPDRLPDGRPNLLRLSRRVAKGELDAEQLARRFPPQPSSWLRAPELHLLFFSALIETAPARALEFLNRFLALHGMARAKWKEPIGVGNVLDAFELQHPPARDGALVSVLMPARNAAATVGYALDSLLALSHGALEILICDDASDDDTAELVRRRYGGEPRVRLFRASRQQGAYNTRNALAAHAHGELFGVSRRR